MPNRRRVVSIVAQRRSGIEFFNALEPLPDVFVQASADVDGIYSLIGDLVDWDRLLVEANSHAAHRHRHGADDDPVEILGADLKRAFLVDDEGERFGLRWRCIHRAPDTRCEWPK